MYVREIHIENIRGFDQVHLDLDRGGGKYAGWTVIAGPNGTGKSTLLRAIALAVAGPSMANKLVQSFAGWVREGAREGKARVNLAVGPKDVYQNPPAMFDRGPEDIGLRWEVQKGGGEPYLLQDGENLTSPWGPWATNPSGWFLAGYGPFRRIGLREDFEAPGPQMAARLASLFNEDHTLAESVQWLKDIYAQRLDYQEQARQSVEKNGWNLGNEAMEIGGDRLGRMSDGILALLNDGLFPEGTRVVRFDLRGLWVEQAGVTMPLRNLSDGYRATIALVFDVVRQLHRCFGDLAISWGEKPVVVIHEGVVLIDEIDAHLHPAWQKRIGFWLKEHFPNIQFIVTTHSPFICQAADAKGLIRLPAPGSGKTAEHVTDEDFRIIVNGGADDAALTALFGLEHAHSDESEKKRTRVAELEATVVRGNASAEDQTELAQLLKTLPDTGSAMIERVLRKHEALR
jgi:energy-coupling factor transporter ATP-binding protein EcfA2